MAGEGGKYYPVIIDDEYFDSVRQASKKLKICTKYIHKRCKSEEWPNYEYTEWRIPKEKLCRICGIVKNLSEFHIKKSNRDGKHTECKVCSNVRSRSFAEKNPDKRKDTQLKLHYGIDLNDYNELFEIQNGKCAICGVHQKYFDKTLAVDHNHDTGDIRGLLCSACNLGIGNLKDDINLLEKAIDYLKKYE